MKRSLLFALMLLTAASTQAAEDPEKLAFFEAKIRPLLVKHCYECHSAEAGVAEGDLRVDSRAALRKGGDRGPAVVPGDVKSGWLLKVVSHADPDLKMPPKQKLSDAALADLRKWIELGAPDPREEAPASAKQVKAGRDFWSYQRPVNPARPAVKDAAWPKNDLDTFILAALEKKGLAPSPDAEPQVLLRRVHFDLVGLPPSPEALDRFAARVAKQGLDAALAAEVDALLARPQFGERWGRHWLDVARFAESSGKEANISFPYAWRYRDYVIDSVNADVPFDRFVREQIAGDLLPAEGNAERARLLIATGFLAIGSKNLDEGDERQFQADLIDEQIDTVTRAVMGSSVACARCHDHKFDPFSMEDYYGLAGIFGSSKTYFGTAVSPANRVGGDPLPLPAVEGQKVFHAGIPVEKVKSLKAEKARLAKQLEEGMAAAKKAVADGTDPEKQFTITDALRIFWVSGGIEGQLEKVSETGEPLPLAMGVLDRDVIADAPKLERGDVKRPAEKIRRAFPQALSQATVAIGERSSGRLELADWLTDPAHPLTSRVQVNRVWHHLFGAGLVRTPDNFGATGERPSHPELLDALALRFTEQGWSLKKLVREIVLSRTYRQASEHRAEAFRQDPENRLLWRASKRRLEAEAIRDAMLSAAGQLETKRPDASLVGRVIGDRPISLIGLDKRLPADLDGALYRSVYLPVIRDRLPDVLELFDFAEPSLVTGARETTNVPLQALYLMNSPFVQARAKALAERLGREADSDAARIRQVFLLCFARPPDEFEAQRALEFLKEGDAKKLASFCQAILSSAEFRNLD